MLENNYDVWKILLELIEEDVDKANLFFNEFFRIFKSVGPAISSNFAMLFLAHNIHFDLLNLQRKLLDTTEDLNRNEVKILCLTFEIISQFTRITTKGSSRVFGESIPIYSVSSDIEEQNQVDKASDCDVVGITGDLNQGSFEENLKGLDVIKEGENSILMDQKTQK
jgi:hypothetical protein